mmetsp:Transcript_4982/g.12075  ORF Transcript_4982/g.12075 Transcript_4982/m.12075 type:complete len:350 (+) Transcript_4982:1376-2425(+)
MIRLSVSVSLMRGNTDMTPDELRLGIIKLLSEENAPLLNTMNTILDSKLQDFFKGLAACRRKPNGQSDGPNFYSDLQKNYAKRILAAKGIQPDDPLAASIVSDARRECGKRLFDSRLSDPYLGVMGTFDSEEQKGEWFLLAWAEIKIRFRRGRNFLTFNGQKIEKMKHHIRRDVKPGTNIYQSIAGFFSTALVEGHVERNLAAADRMNAMPRERQDEQLKGYWGRTKASGAEMRRPPEVLLNGLMGRGKEAYSKSGVAVFASVQCRECGEMSPVVLPWVPKDLGAAFQKLCDVPKTALRHPNCPAKADNEVPQRVLRKLHPTTADLIRDYPDIARLCKKTKSTWISPRA